MRATLSDLTVSDLLVAPGAAYDLDFDDIAESFSADFRDSLLIVPSIAQTRTGSRLLHSRVSRQLWTRYKTKTNWLGALLNFTTPRFMRGHSLIRLLGESCSYLDRTHINKVAAVGAAIGKAPAFAIERGVYRCQTNAAATAIRCSKVSGPLGGAHERFGACFEVVSRLGISRSFAGLWSRRRLSASLSNLKP